MALDGLSFTVMPGQVTGFVGPNGAGKSTTMRVILGLDSIDEGSALIAGRPYRSLQRPLSHVGSLLDAAALQPSRTGRNHLLWLAHSQGLPARRVDEVIELTGLQTAARRKAGGFSLGMRQRLGLAAALLGDPPVLMLDEPFNGLDPEGIVWMRGLLRALAAEGRAVLVSSHLMSELQDVAGHLVVIGRGRLIADTSVADLLAAASRGLVTLRTAALAEARAALTSAGAAVVVTGPDALTVSGLAPERVVTVLGGSAVAFSEVSVHHATLEEAYMELTESRGRVPRRRSRGEAAMTPAPTPYRSSAPAGRAGFLQLLRAEWTKFRTVRGWVIGTFALVLAMVLVSLLAASGSKMSVKAAPGQPAAHGPSVTLGPGGEPVNDTFHFVHRSLQGDGSITVRISSLTGRIILPDGDTQPGLQPWSKAGIIVKEGLTPGSTYAALMITGAHGVRMQYDYVHDAAGSSGSVSSASPRWLRLTRAGATLTGYESADGSHWTKVSAARLSGLSDTVQAGLLVASPRYEQVSSQLGGASGDDEITVATAVFDHVDLRGSWLAKAWVGEDVGSGHQQRPGTAGALQELGGRLTVSGSGDIAPIPAGGGVAGLPVERSLSGGFAALVVAIVLGVLFITAEYRRGLIHTTLIAGPRRGRVLVAKAVVVGSVTFVAGLAAAAVALPLGERILRANGNALYPVSMLTELRVVAGTAALLAVTAVLALAVGTVFRRSAAAVAVVIAATVLPYILAVSSVLPTGAGQWLLRLTPAAAFAIQQSVPQFPQVPHAYTAQEGYFPLTPWVGFGVLCAYAVVAFGLAVFALHRRDA